MAQKIQTEKKEKPFIYFHCIELQQFNIIHICTEFQNYTFNISPLNFECFFTQQYNYFIDFVVNMAIVKIIHAHITAKTFLYRTFSLMKHCV